MRKIVAVLLTAAVILPAGCRKQTGPPVQPTKFDKKTDGPPSWTKYRADPGLVKDQAEVARQMALAPVPAATSAPATQPASPAEAVEAVKQTVGKIIEVAKANQPDRLADFFLPEDAGTLRSLLAAAKDMPGKSSAFEQLVKTKLGMELPQDLKKDLQQMSGPAGGTGQVPTATPAGALAGPPGPEAFLGLGTSTDPAGLKFEVQGQDVFVTGPGGQKTAFANTAQGWKIRLSPEEKQFLPVIGDLVTAYGKFLDAMTAGINDGSITKDNFEAKAKELGEKQIKPAAEKFGAMMMEMMKKAFEQMGGATTAPAPVDTSP